MDLTRRALLAGGAVAAAAVACGGTSSGAEATPKTGGWIWALHTRDLVVPHATWVKVPWDRIAINTTGAHLVEGAVWVFPTATAPGIWGVLLNVAWDNTRSPSGKKIQPKTHRKLARFVQQDVGDPQNDQTMIAGAASESAYLEEYAALGDQDLLADGSIGYQQQQVNIQLGVGRTGPDQRAWFEVYQNSGQPLVCRFDGSHVPKTATTPPISSLQAPSIMVAKMTDV
jgi:hypothetical protein